MVRKHFLYLMVLARCAFPDDDLPRGRVVDRVVCSGSPDQTYALYLPSEYSRKHTWPILYCLDPGARGTLPLERFREAAGRAGFIVAGSNNSRNGSMEVAREAIDWLLTDTHERFAIDDSHIYVAGFSGGARLALAWAANGRIAGVIACGAGFPASRTPKEISFRLFATAGVDDFNYDEVYAMSSELSRRGSPQRFAQFAGGHDWLPETLAGEALDFLSGRAAAAPPPAASSEQKSAAARFLRLREQIERGDERTRRPLIERLRRDSKRDDDSQDRRVARRVLMGVFIGAVEQGRGALEAKKYPEAAQAWELAVVARPENAEAWYALAESRAGARDKRRAIEALKHAIDNGFHDRDRIERNPLFESLRKEPKYSDVISALNR